MNRTKNQKSISQQYFLLRLLENKNIMNLQNSNSQKIYLDKKIGLKYNILGKIGEGQFGKIYKVINRATLNYSALKVEECAELCENSVLLREIFILKELRNLEGIPQIYQYGKCNCGFYIEMELFQCTLFDERSKVYSENQILSMTLEILQILKRIHERGIVHQDLKPHNIMRNKEGKLIIIDFGLADFIRSPKTISHQKKMTKKGFIGTLRYASLSAHKGFYQSEKDDVESLLYIIGYLKLKFTPWMNVEADSDEERIEKITSLKVNKGMRWMKQSHEKLGKIYEYVRNLKERDPLDYNYIMQIILRNCKTGVFNQNDFIKEFQKKNSAGTKRDSLYGAQGPELERRASGFASTFSCHQKKYEPQPIETTALMSYKPRKIEFKNPFSTYPS